MKSDLSGKCGCGRDGKYMCFKDGEEVLSCNKYARCLTYEELNEKYVNLLKDNSKLLKAAITVITFREGTESYVEAENVIKRMVGEKYE